MLKSSSLTRREVPQLGKQEMQYGALKEQVLSQAPTSDWHVNLFTWPTRDFRCFKLTSNLPPNPLLASRGAYHNLTYTKSNNQVTLATFSSLHIESLPGHGKSLETRREIVEKVSFDALSLERYLPF